MLWYLRYLWSEYRFKRRWQKIYDEAPPIESVGALYLSICPPEQQPKVIAAVDRVWPLIPREAQDSLTFAWKNLQNHWDRRRTGVRLHLPICGVFRTSFDFAGERGGFAGRAARATKWNGYSDSGQSLMKLFANMYLPLRLGFRETPPEALHIEVARRIASYYLCVNRGIEMWTLLDGYHNETDDLVRSWELTWQVD